MVSWMTKSYLPYDPDQQLLLPQALREWLPEGHLAYLEPILITGENSRSRSGKPG